MLVFFLFFFTFGIIEFFTNNKLIKNIFFILSSFFIFIILGFNRWSYDYNNYLNRYINYTKIKEKGFIILTKYINSYFPFKGHEAILLIVGLLIFLLFLKIKSKDLNMSFVVFLYAIYPLVLDINQTKNLYMYIFFIFSIFYLTKKKDIKFLIFNYLGMQFHRVGILYFPLYFFRKYSIKKAYKIFIFIFIFTFIFSDILLILANKYYGDKLILYVRTKKSITPYFYLGMIFLDMTLVYLINKKYKNIFNNLELKIYSIALVYPIIYIPLFFYVGNISRLYRNLFILKYIFYSKIIYKIKLIDKILIFLYALFISCINLLLYQIISPNFPYFKFFTENQVIYFFKDIFL